jgi:hypothetical protein
MPGSSVRLLWLVAALGLATARVASAQQAADLSPDFEDDLVVVADSGAADARLPAALPDTVPAAADSLMGVPPWRQPSPNAVRALGEVAILNVSATAINHLTRDIPWSRPDTWWANVSGGVEWDKNDIRVNALEHPWAGAMYFNVGRSNGLGFWGAAPVAVFGSLFWELFGEANKPAANDLFFTSLSGIAMGEPLYRLSLMVLDNEARGLDRVWREATVMLVNPGFGLDRLSKGDTWHRRGNMPGRWPDALRGRVALGARRLPSASPSRLAGETAGTATFGLRYGDPFDGAPVRPFSSFTASVELMPKSSDFLTQLGTRGILTTFGRREGPTNRVTGLFFDFDYRWDRVLAFSEQSIGLGTMTRHGEGRWRFYTDLSAEAVPIAATIERSSEPSVGRIYDFGSGVGGRVAGRIERDALPVLQASYRAYWLGTLNGVSSSKLVQIAALGASVPVAGDFSVGASWWVYLQRSSYREGPTQSLSLPTLSLFVSLGR